MALLPYTAPAPSSPEQYIANQCIADNANEFSIPRVPGGDPKNCRRAEHGESGYVHFISLPY